jgi:hypothetical protein
MKYLTRLFVMALASVAGAVVIDTVRQRRRLREPTRDRELDIEDATLIATNSGLASIDPQPITHVAGEGIVPGEDDQSRDNVQSVRDRLPRPGGR